VPGAPQVPSLRAARCRHQQTISRQGRSDSRHKRGQDQAPASAIWVFSYSFCAVDPAASAARRRAHTSGAATMRICAGSLHSTALLARTLEHLLQRAQVAARHACGSRSSPTEPHVSPRTGVRPEQAQRYQTVAPRDTPDAGQGKNLKQRKLCNKYVLYVCTRDPTSAQRRAGRGCNEVS